MKKILLMILTIILILSVNVLAVDIDIGNLATDRAGFTSDVRRTYVDKNNPANASGVIDTIEMWANTDLSDVEVATFFVVSGNNLSTRATHPIGEVTAGAKRTFSGLSIEVQEGDYLGLTYSGGKLDKDDVGVGYWYTTVDSIPCTNTVFTFGADRTISLYGTGATVVGWDHKWNTQTISKWNTKEFTKWNGLE